MEPERSRPPLSVEEFVARILEKRDPVWEHYVEEPRDRLRQRQRRAGLRIGPAGAPSDADDSRSQSQSSHALSATEAFVARITGRPTRLDTAAFVAAITGRDGPAGTPTSDAQYLDEAHFNPDEPRDERGRWTTDGSRSSNDGRGLFSINDPVDETPELSPERKAQFARAAAELDAMVAAGKISKKERDLRYELVKAALGHKMGFNAKEKPNPAHFEMRINSQGDDEYYLKPGHVADAAHDRVYRISGIGSNTGCKQATRTLMLEAQAQLAKNLGKSAEFDKEAGGKSLAELYPDYMDSPLQAYTGDSNGLDPKSFVPGDRVRMDNHKYSKADGDPTGNEGSNVIYLGKDSNGDQQFLHMDGGSIEDLPHLKRTVRSYTLDPGRQDPNIDNYRFKERYRPRVAPSLGQ